MTEFDPHKIERGIAQGGGQALNDFARDGLLKFLRDQIVDAEWEIARQKARIDAYEKAVSAIETTTTGPAR